MAGQTSTTPARPPKGRTAPVQAAHELPPTNLLLGALLMLAAMVLLPIMDGVAKGLSDRYPVLQVVWARYLFHLIAMLPIVLLRYRPAELVPRRAGLQLVRGALLLAGTALFFGGLAQLPQATVLALFFVSPLVVTVLAPLLLGERVGLWRILAVVVGFAGVILILRPGSGTLSWGAALALGAGVVHGFYMIFTRRLAGSAPPLVTLGYTAVVGAVIMSVVMLFVWVTPTPVDFLLMILVGVLAAGGHFLIIKAFDHAPATFLAPLGYAEMVTAILYGFLAYGHLPDPLGWFGIAVIVGAGVAVTLWESRGARRRPLRAFRELRSNGPKR